MAFRILKKVKDGGSTLNSLYQFVPTTIDGVSYYLEFNTKEEVDAYVEEQLNLGLPKTSLEVVAPMKYTVSASIDEEECGCGVPSTNPTPASKPYRIIANPVGGVVEKGMKITYIIDGDRADFQKLIIDDVVVNSNYYTVTAGSTIISIAEIFAATLSVGTHTIKFVFVDGEATDTLEITETSESGDSSDTDDTENSGGSTSENEPSTPEDGDSSEGTTDSDPSNSDNSESSDENTEESGNEPEGNESGTSDNEGTENTETNPEQSGTESSEENNTEDTAGSTPEPEGSEVGEPNE